MYSILFIGNSYTYFNTLPAIFKEIANSAGIDVSVAAVTQGGWTLEKHADINDVYGCSTDAVLKGKKFDFVILQEQSVRPALEFKKFREAVKKLLVKIKENGAKPCLYATWGRKEGSTVLGDNGWTNKSMTEKLSAAYDSVGNEFGIPVAHVGNAFYEFNTKATGMDLYTSDLSHPSKYGSFLAALTIFATVFDKDPINVPYNYIFTEEEAAVLKNAAKNKEFIK
ncbi:MAG: hypothetical protein IJC81_04170 [Clostridia bacterium]|nr:hypothetical protein [Clostridia bacterium]